MNWRTQFLTLAATMVLFGVASNSLAVPYASFVRDIGGGMWEFVLNEDADDVTVLRDGANPVNLGTTAGRYMFDMTSFSDFEIQVSKSAPVGWTTISDDTNRFTHYERPPGVAVNTNPASPYFGTVYVNNARDLPTVSGRPMGVGVYSLTADLIGVDLPNNFVPVANPDDATLAKSTGWTTLPASAVNPWRMVIDADDNLIISDWSDDAGGIKYMSPDLATGGLVLGGFDALGAPQPEGGPTGGVFSSVSDEFGPIPLHGSIASQAMITGTLNNDLTVWAIDEDLDPELSHPGDDGNSIWRWDVGSATNYDINPTLVIDAKAIPDTSDGRDNWIASQAGVQTEAFYDPVRNKFYLSQRRADGNQAGLIVVTPDGVDGLSPTLEWSSLQFSIDNELDGFENLPDPPAGTSADFQDIFRQFGGGMTVSEDGTKLYLHRNANPENNVALGSTSDISGAVVIIPLDENGIPDIQVEEGVITNLDSIITQSNDAAAFARGLAIDAAGNVYTTNNNAERLEVFSPGGSFMAVTSSDGTFALTPIEGGLEGDHNGDGFVNAADYVFWRDQMSDDAGAYTAWHDNFGASAGSGAGAAVPEPTSIVAMLTCLAGMLFLRRPFGLLKR